MNRLDRHKKRKQRLNTVSLEDADTKIVKELQESSVDEEKLKSTFDIIEKHYTVDLDLNISRDEARDFLNQFQKDFNQERFDQLVSDCQKNVISSIVIPFGLGHIVSAYDKVGGNVDTVHNVREGVYSTEGEKQAYENRGEYNSDEYHKDRNFIKINKTHSEQRDKGEAVDYMSGEKMAKNSKYDLDHVKSAKEIHDDRGRVLAEVKGNEIANTESNLKATSATKNRSKKADSMETFLEKKNERIQKIEELKQKQSLSDSDQKELKKLQDLSTIDDQKAMQMDEQARKEIDKKINFEYYTSKKFASAVAITGVKEGAKMGAQQAIGLVMTEFFTAVFDEILDIYKNGFSNGFDDEKLFYILKERCKRIGKRILSKWKDVAIAFKDGMISGFISNLITVFANSMKTTFKRLNRLIREGIYSIFKAIKMLLYPPKDISSEELFHEVKKVIASGIIVSVGIIAEEYVSKLIEGTAFLKAFEPYITSIFIGTITGLAVTYVAYYLDKNKNKKDAIDELLDQSNQKIDELQLLINKY